MRRLRARAHIAGWQARIADRTTVRSRARRRKRGYMTAHTRRIGAALTLAALAVHGRALAVEEHAEEASGGVPWTGFLVVLVITIVVPVLFLVATQLRPPGADEQDEELEPVVAGIGQGTAPVPRWLYALYVLIPAWGLFYLLNSTAVRSELVPPTPVPTATPERTAGPAATPRISNEVSLVARDLEFNTSSVSVLAGQPVTVALRNQDPATLHNFAVYTDESLAETIYKGELFSGVDTKSFSFPAPPAGSYHFQCDVHPATMTGTLTSAA